MWFTFSILTAALSTLAIAAPSKSFIPKDHYLKNIAPIQLQRLSNFASEHKDTLTADQQAFISNATSAVSTFDTSSFDSLRSQADVLFSPADAKYILTGKTAAAKTRRDENDVLSQRFVSCECATESNWCDNNQYCKGGADGCNYAPSGCGTLDGYPCDGLCENGN